MKISYVVGLLLILTGFSLYSCGDGTSNKEVKPLTREELKEAIVEMEDSLKVLQQKGQKIESLHRIELINRLLAYYRGYPEDEYSAVCLDKTQMIYSTLEAPEYAVAYCDTLLEKYPKYKNRALVLESQGANYDVFVTPRDSAMVRKYYTMLLEEFPKLSDEKKRGIRKRLQHNDLTFEEYLLKL